MSLQHSLHKICCFSALFIFAALTLVVKASGAPIDVDAELSRNRVPAGDMVQLDVKITGTDQADLPADISVDGLQIRLAGQSTQVQMVNYSVSSSILYSYIIIPMRSGTFTIPPIKVRAQGKYFSTSPMQLTVVGSASSSNTSQPINQPTQSPAVTFSAPMNRRRAMHASNNKTTFAELTVPKKKLYVGEVEPVEIKFYFDAHYQVKPLSGINFGGEGLLVDRFSEPQVSRTERNGSLYNVVTFQTLLSAVKPGPVDITPASIDALVEIPGAAPAGMDPALFQQLFGNLGGSFQQQKVTLKSNKLSLEVMPLPTTDKPADFSGAIGEFHLDASATPTKITTGDPITLSLKLEGKGNFKAIPSPQLTQAQAWKTYPSSDHFEAADNLGWKGTKTFDTTMIAQQPQVATPGSSFTYFDPEKIKYVTLTTDPVPLVMTPATNSSLNNNAPTAASTAATPAATPISPSSKHNSLTTFSLHYWKNPFYRFDFLIIWLSFLTATLLLTVALSIKKYYSAEGSPHKQHRLKLKKLLAQLQSDDLDALQFTTTAVQYGEGIIQDALFKTNISPENQEKIIAELQEIITRNNEINYGARELLLRKIERQKILTILSHWYQLLEKK